MSNLAINYRPEIDGLRALAVLPVILFHADFYYFSGGYVGVDVFFVISGYLITSIIISDLERNNFSLLDFYERRARRLLPALFLVMLFSLALSLLVLTAKDLQNFGKSLIAVSTFSSNILFWLESGYFDIASELKPLIHTWSLAVEEQYYIIFPLFLLYTWHLGLKKILSILFLVFIISLALAIWGSSNLPSANFFLLPFRVWELLLGVFAAIYLKYQGFSQYQSFNQFISTIGFGMIIYSIFFFDEYTPFPSLYTLIPTIGTSLIIIFTTKNTLINRILSSRLLVGIGLISYSAYLWHQPFLAFARHASLSELSNFIIILLCISSLLAAWMSYHLVEKPFRDKSKIGRNSIFILSIAFMIGFSFMGFLLYKKVEDTKTIQLSDVLIEKPIKFKGIFHEGRDCSFPALKDDQDFCQIFGTNKNADKILLIGDSHARVLSEIFYNNQSHFSSLIDLTSSGCPFIMETNIFIGRKLNCSKEYQDSRKRVLKMNSDAVVVYQSRLPLYLYGDGFYNGKSDGREIRENIIATSQLGLDKTENQKSFLENLKKTLSFIAENNTHLYLILPSFSNGWDPIKKLEKMAKLNYSIYVAKDYFDIPLSVVNERISQISNIFLEIESEYENITLVDPNQYLCSKNSCNPISNQNKLLFTDPDHLSSEANLLIFNEIALKMNHN